MNGRALQARYISWWSIKQERHPFVAYTSPEQFTRDPRIVAEITKGCFIVAHTEDGGRLWGFASELDRRKFLKRFGGEEL